MTVKKIGRNVPCPCGSGKKYKKCCLLSEKKEQSLVSTQMIQDLQNAIEHHQAGRLSEAQAIYKKILDLMPDNADALHYSGLIYYQTGDSETAITLISRSIAINPSHLMYCNLGAALQAQGLHDLAIESYQSAIQLKPDYAEAYNNLGAALQEQGKITESIKAFQHVLSILPDYASAQNNLGNAFLVQGNLKEAIDCYRNSLTLDNANLSTHSNLLLALSYYSQCSLKQYYDESCNYGNKVLAKARPYKQWSAFLTDNKEKKLRVGFVSGDFKIHPVGYFLESIFAHINSERFELTAYVTQLREDALTARIKPCFSEWNVIYGMSNEQAAQKIFADEIDILVDLSGHTSGNRLAVFAWKPAPVQVSWLGFFASTGVPGIDYLLTDAISVSESQSKYFSEKFYYLPETRLCFTQPDTNLKPGSVPAKANHYITFGCFQNLSKINYAVIEVWGRIFKVLPKARLVVRNKQMTCLDERKNLQQRLMSVGIQSERIKIEEPLAREDYLASYSEIDILLDTFPYPGGTTTCEALWMGVPTLTLLGDTLLARQGASLFNCAGLQEWIAKDEDDYVAKAVKYATNIEYLVELRKVLRSQVQETALFNAARFSEQLEEAMSAMWKQKLFE